MTHEDFKQLVTTMLNSATDVLIQKDKEYSSDTDRLHNFKKAGRMSNQTPIKALDGMWLKHRVSIDDIINQMEADPSYIPDKSLVKDKFLDNINYTLLALACIEERRK